MLDETAPARCERCGLWKPTGAVNATVGECTNREGVRLVLYHDEIPSNPAEILLTTYDFGCVQWEAAPAWKP